MSRLGVFHTIFSVKRSRSYFFLEISDLNSSYQTLNICRALYGQMGGIRCVRSVRRYHHVPKYKRYSSCRYNERQLIDVTVVRRVRPRAELNVRTYRFLPADTRYIRIWYIIRIWYHTYVPHFMIPGTYQIRMIPGTTCRCTISSTAVSLFVYSLVGGGTHDTYVPPKKQLYRYLFIR